MTVMALEAPSHFVFTPGKTFLESEKTASALKSLKSLAVDLQEALQLPATQENEAKIFVKPQSTDEQLISAICTGNDAAIELLYDRYHRYAYALAYSILRDPSAAEDIVQDAFLSIWRKAFSYHAQTGSVQSWIQAIVRNRSIDKIRASAHRDYQWTPLQVENEQDPASEQPDVWEQVWQSEQHRIIYEVMEQIPHEQRLVIELAYFGGLTQAEIAEQYQIPLGTVKGRMRLGLQKMKSLLAERGLGNI